MSTLYVLDTNAWSDVLRGTGRVGRKLSSVPVVRVLIPSPAIYELRRGSAAKDAAFRKSIDELVRTYEVAALDTEAAQAAVQTALWLRRSGRVLHHLDALIAGIAIAREATLVTRDKDFAKAPALKIQDWT